MSATESQLFPVDRGDFEVRRFSVSDASGAGEFGKEEESEAPASAPLYAIQLHRRDLRVDSSSR